MVDCVFSSITETLKNKGRIVLVGLGPFKVEKRKPRKGKILQTEEGNKIKAEWGPKSIAGKDLKVAVK